MNAVRKPSRRQYQHFTLAFGRFMMDKIIAIHYLFSGQPKTQEAVISATVAIGIEEDDPDIRASFRRDVEKFLLRGGHIEIAPSRSSEDRDDFCIELPEHAVLYPVCHFGAVRSRLMWSVLQEIGHKKPVTLLPPHGTQGGADSGFDRYDPQKRYDFHRLFKNTHGAVKAAILLSGSERRFGDTVIPPCNPIETDDSTRTEEEYRTYQPIAQTHFNTHYFGLIHHPDHAQKPHIFFAFQHAVRRIIPRLLDRAGESGRLDGVRIIVIPDDDEVTRLVDKSEHDDPDTYAIEKAEAVKASFSRMVK